MALSPDIMKTYGRIDIAFTHGKGSFLFSEDGSKYLDYATGIAVNAFGHSHPDLIMHCKTKLLNYGMYQTFIKSQNKIKLQIYW